MASKKETERVAASKAYPFYTEDYFLTKSELDTLRIALSAIETLIGDKSAEADGVKIDGGEIKKLAERIWYADEVRLSFDRMIERAP